MTSRFAPSPTGHLHLGHAWSALFCQSHAQSGEIILRIEDIDIGRCRPEFVVGIYEDLEWLGLLWKSPVRLQSEHFNDYSAVLQSLDARGLLYPCFCTRRDILAEIERAGSAPHGPEGTLYPGTCKHLTQDERHGKIAAGIPYALRLDMDKAMGYTKRTLTWLDIYRGEQTSTPAILGDVVLARKGIPASYHLCVTADDHAQGITHVTRGDDLFYATHLHCLIQDLMGYDTPVWAHHPLLLDGDGNRFAKRNKSVTIRSLREQQGLSRGDVIEMITQALPESGPWRQILVDL